MLQKVTLGSAATDGGATTSAIQSWTPSIRCAQPQYVLQEYSMQLRFIDYTIPKR